MTDAAGGWTKGPCEIVKTTTGGLCITGRAADGSRGFPIARLTTSTKEDWIDARLIAEAFNVATETGLSPRQLAERLRIAERQNADVQMNSFMWMNAHDALKAGKDYSLPTPADLPNAIARAEAIEAVLIAVKRGAEYPDDLGDMIDGALDRTTRPAAKGEG